SLGIPAKETEVAVGLQIRLLDDVPGVDFRLHPSPELDSCEQFEVRAISFEQGAPRGVVSRPGLLEELSSISRHARAPSLQSRTALPNRRAERDFPTQSRFFPYFHGTGARPRFPAGQKWRAGGCEPRIIPRRSNLTTFNIRSTLRMERGSAG